jgi:hypothetical protein
VRIARHAQVSKQMNRLPHAITRDVKNYGTKYGKTLKTKMEKCYTHHIIRECIITGLKKTMTGDTTILNPHKLSFTPTGSVQRAIAAQNKIGWNNFYRGQIALEWLTAQQEQYEGKYKTKQDTEQWATTIIKAIWHRFLNIWESRKEDQHGRDLIQQKEKERNLLLKRTRKLYEKIQQYDEQDKRYFREPIEHWEQATNKNIKEWLVITEKLAEKSKERATKKVQQNQPRITSHFNRATEIAPQERRDKTYNRRPPRKPPHEC